MENWQKLPSLIQSDFHLTEAHLSLLENPDFVYFKNRLTQIIRYLIDNELERLINAMYRIDIQESDFRAALAQDDAEKIAELVITREMQKVITREKYKKF